jgi:hypothetical protein
MELYQVKKANIGRLTKKTHCFLIFEVIHIYELFPYSFKILQK